MPREPAPHVPVMVAEVIRYLAPVAGGLYVDCTAGAGGHSRAIAEVLAAGGGGRLLALDKDPAALALTGQRARVAGVELELIQSDFGDMEQQLRERGIGQVNGVVADLGMSSMQLADAGRGFSFAADGPLDMRMDPRQALTAEQVVNQSDERELADLIFQFGDERRSRSIARAIVRSRPLYTTAQLAGVIAAVNRPMKSRRRPLHPATRTFQALRIFVNSELHSLEHWLDTLPAVLEAGGRAVVISFHSLEDRPVKHRFRAWAQAGQATLLTPRALRPSAAEVEANPRSRSAKLRAIEWRG